MHFSDEDFLARFEQRTLPAEDFDHRGHLRLAWLYLSHHPLDEAIGKTTRGIEAYAASLGAAAKFHHTLTEAIVRIMHRRLQENGCATFEAFLAGNPDLVENMADVVSSHYSQCRLNSDAARQSFVPPDLRRL